MNRQLMDYTQKDLLISPSLLAADFANLKYEIQRIENSGAELLHLDIMDGHFVPNLTFGPPIIASLRKHSNMLFDVHLMLTNPIKYVQPFVKAGANIITFHVECEDEANEVIKTIRAENVAVGISIKPKTSPAVLLPYLHLVDMVLVMSVEPGFGGQSFMPEVLEHVKFLKTHIKEMGLKTHIQIDGGIDAKTAPLAKEAGCNVLVAGTAVFKHPEGEKIAMELLRK